MHEEMIITPQYPIVVKMGHGQAGFGKIKVDNHKIFGDVKSMVATTGQYCTAERYIEGAHDLRLQKIGDNYQAYKRTAMSGNWKTNTGTSMIEMIEVLPRYKFWMDECSMAFGGGLDICSVDVLVAAEDGKEYILEFNGTASGFGDHDKDNIILRDYVMRKMNEFFVDGDESLNQQKYLNNDDLVRNIKDEEQYDDEKHVQNDVEEEANGDGKTGNVVEPRKFRIVMFGDSTTWGYCPDSQDRLDAEHRHPNVLEKALNREDPDQYQVEVISEGLAGRTINEHDAEDERNQRRGLSMKGMDQILPTLYSHKAIDIVVVMLGINDTNPKFKLSAVDIANNMDRLLEKCVNAEIWPWSPPEMAHGPQIVCIAPAPITELNKTNQGWGYNESAMRVSQSLHTEYRKICEKYSSDVVHFVNAGDHVVTGSDSLHLDGENNIKLGNALVPVMKGIIKHLQGKQRNNDAPDLDVVEEANGGDVVDNEPKIETNQSDGDRIAENSTPVQESTTV